MRGWLARNCMQSQMTPLCVVVHTAHVCVRAHKRMHNGRRLNGRALLPRIVQGERCVGGVFAEAPNRMRPSRTRAPYTRFHYISRRVT